MRTAHHSASTLEAASASTAGPADAWKTDLLAWDASELGLDEASVEAALGYPPGAMPPPVHDHVQMLLEEAPAHLTPVAGYRIVPKPAVETAKASVRLAGVSFETGPIIGLGLNDAHEMIIFAASAGPALDAWMKHAFEDQGDLMAGYLISAIGSEAVEQTANLLEAHLRSDANARGWGVTNRYSPGYCDWSVDEQHKLFSLLPRGFCGIELTPSALMQPVKSVSGFAGLGPNCVKTDYACKHCTLENCFRRNTRML